MCGIVGAVTHEDSVRTAIEALKRLEYRGYDSYGLATLAGGTLEVRKDIGSVSKADQQQIFGGMRASGVVLAHTRWATHGGVEQKNAHPHLSNNRKFAVVHNGVIENFRALRDRIAQAGVRLRSETDTEVIVQLLELLHAEHGSVDEAFLRTLDALEGEYALVVCSVHEPGALRAACFKSPLAFGEIPGGVILASDQRAIAPLTTAVTFLEEGDIIVATPDTVHVSSRRNGKVTPVDRTPTEVEQRDSDTGLHGYAHYMIKEIHECPIAIRNVMSLADDTFRAPVNAFRNRAVNLVGAGSAFYVSLLGQYYFAQLARRTVTTIPSDEFANLKQLTTRDHLIAVSQSGETFDTLEVMRRGKEAGAAVTAINNVIGCSSQRLADFPIFQGAGPEICVLSTKSIVSQAMVLYRLVVECAVQDGAIDTADQRAYHDAAEDLAQQIEVFLESQNNHVRDLAQRCSRIANWFFIGRSMQYPVALESALKFKEVSYLHAEGMPAGFLKHGTISLIDTAFYTIAFLPHKRSDPDTYRFTVSNIEEIQARDGNVILVGHDEELVRDLDDNAGAIILPHVNLYLDPVLQLVAGQLLAYHCAVALGRNIDQPRALAKSVTVR